MEASYYVGIDIGNSRLDWHINGAQNTALITGQTANTLNGNFLDREGRKTTRSNFSVYSFRLHTLCA